MFEDIDIVFFDEGDFYMQLSKLMAVTKVPIILTASNSTYVCENLLPLLQKQSIEFEMIKYAFHRPSRSDLFSQCMLIKLFEGPISQMLKNNDQLITLSTDQVNQASTVLCSEKILSETSHTVKAILHDSTKDGLPAILNRIQLSKNK